MIKFRIDPHDLYFSRPEFILISRRLLYSTKGTAVSPTSTGVNAQIIAVPYGFFFYLKGNNSLLLNRITYPINNCLFIKRVFTWASPLEVGGTTSVQHLQTHVPVQLSHVSEHASAIFGLVQHTESGEFCKFFNKSAL